MPPEAFVARFVPWRRAAAVVLSVGFVALGLWIAGGGDVVVGVQGTDRRFDALRAAVQRFTAASPVR